MKSDDTIEQEAAVWFAAQRRGPMSLDERQSFDAWRADPLHQAALNHMHELWGEMSTIREMDVAPRRRAAPFNRAALIAAVTVLGLTVMGGGAWWRFDRSTIQTNIGEQRSQELVDGSIVALNVVTRARYDMNARERVVRMNEGEATFWVRKDPERPFLVRTGSYEIRAVGTAFNVRNRDHNLDVSVKEGVIEVRRLADDGQPVRLHAGQRLQVKDTDSERGTTLKVSDIPIGVVDEWRQRVLTYEDAPVSQIVQDFNRFYERPVTVDPSFGRRHVTLRLVIDDRADTVGRLAALLGAEVNRAGQTDTLTPLV